MLFKVAFQIVRWFLWSRFALDYREAFFPQEETMSAWVSFWPVKVCLTEFLPWYESIATIGINTRWGYLTLEFREGEFHPQPVCIHFIRYRRS